MSDRRPSTEEAVKEEEKWMPTMSGTTTAYQPEYREGHWFEGEVRWTKWQSIRTQDGRGDHGASYPAFAGGMFRTIGLFGYEQAQALAWSFAARASADMVKIETRVAVFDFTYDMKARRLEGKEIACSVKQ